MSNVKYLALGAALLGSAAVWSAPASAQATRTWVSGVGDDVNPCSRTAPCKTFAGAISKTAAAGEINCLDPGGFGGVTITKALSIVCDGVEAGVLVGGNGITINAGAADLVYLSGLDFQGVSSATNGISFIAGGGLTVRNSSIRGFTVEGISFTPAASAVLTLDNVVISNNGTVGSASPSGGVRVVPGNGTPVKMVVSNTKFLDNANVGLDVDMNGTTGTGANVQVIGSQFLNSGSGLTLKAPTGTGSINAMLINSLVAGNTGYGVLVRGVLATARLSNMTVTGNNYGLFVAAQANLSTYGDNRIDGNTQDSAFVATIPKK